MNLLIMDVSCECGCYNYNLVSTNIIRYYCCRCSKELDISNVKITEKDSMTADVV